MEISTSDAVGLAIAVRRKLRELGVQVETNYVIQPVAGIVSVGISPGPGVSVLKIMARADDIQLAVGASHVRVYVDHIARAVMAEIPVGAPPILYTSSLLDSAQPYCMTIGKLVNGATKVINIKNAATPHVLIAGTTGAGKSALWHSMLATICHATPRVQVLTYDPIHAQMPWIAESLRGHVLGQASKPDQMIRALGWACDLMDRGRAANEDRILICIDEVKDLLDVADIERVLVRLATRGRNHGIHLMLATQNPSAKVLSADLVACMPVRIVLSVVRDVDSRVASGGKILDAHKLPKPGAGMMASGNEVVRFVAAMPDQYETAQERGAASEREGAPAQELLPLIIRSPSPDRRQIQMQRDFALPRLASPVGEVVPSALQTIESEPVAMAERSADSYTLRERIALIMEWNPAVSVSALQNALKPGGAQNGFAVVTQIVNELKAEQGMPQ